MQSTILKLVFLFILSLVLSTCSVSFGQKWVDTKYSIETRKDSTFGSAVDFAGNMRNLEMDISFPTNDTIPRCGRPLVVVLYGGAFMAGNKEDGQVQQLMKDFAQRGYVAIAPNYRLGMFQTERQINCNVSGLFNIEWNCLNAQDTIEWYRAYYRAVQDAKGAIRYMIAHKDSFQIDPDNVFITGFSAGGFVALGAALLDHPSEWNAFSLAVDTAKSPNTIYDNGCVKKYQWDTSISSMNLARPSLGNLYGNIHTAQIGKYTIKGVGNFFGAMFYNLLDSGSTNMPGIYTYHQPNDLIVPYNGGRRVFDGYSACMYGVCNQGIINRPVVYSSTSIRDWSVSLKTAGKPYPDIYFDSTKNNTDCLGQIADPNKGGHQFDNFAQRTLNVAKYFASLIDTGTCVHVGIERQSLAHGVEIYPNPVNNEFRIQAQKGFQKIRIYDFRGILLVEEKFESCTFKIMDIQFLKPSILYVEVEFEDSQVVRKSLVKTP
jgi:alpha/beta superfamily hydrolase